MYILEYWISESEEDWYENLAVANSIDTLKNSPQLHKKLEEILEPARDKWELSQSTWTERAEDFIRGIIRSKIQLVLFKGNQVIATVDRGYFVIRPIPYVEGN